MPSKQAAVVKSCHKLAHLQSTTCTRCALCLHFFLPSCLVDMKHYMNARVLLVAWILHLLSNKRTDAADPPVSVFNQSGATSTVKFGCILPFSGGKAQAGFAERAALEMAIQDHPLPKTTIELHCMDTQCLPDEAAAKMSLLADNKAMGVVGELCSVATVGAVPVATARQVPLISAASGASNLSAAGDYFLRTIPSDAYQGLAAAKLVYSRGGRRIALLVESSTTYGAGLANDFSNVFTQLDGTAIPLKFTIKNWLQGNPRRAVEALIAANGTIDSVFLSTNNNTWLASFLNVAQRKKIMLPLFGGGGVADPALLGLIPPDSPSAVGRLHGTIVSPGTRAFRDRFASYTNNSYGYHAGVAHAYDAMYALLQAYGAVKKTGPLLLAQLHSLKFGGVSGPIEFNEYGDLKPGDKSYVDMRFSRTAGTIIYGNYIPLGL